MDPLRQISPVPDRIKAFGDRILANLKIVEQEEQQALAKRPLEMRVIRTAAEAREVVATIRRVDEQLELPFPEQPRTTILCKLTAKGGIGKSILFPRFRGPQDDKGAA